MPIVGHHIDPLSIDDDLFERDAVEDRRLRREEARATAERQAAETAARDAAFLAKAIERSKENHRRALLAEYRAAGIDPPKLDGDGAPTCSLALLRRLGWTVEYIGEGRTALVAPARSA